MTIALRSDYDADAVRKAARTARDAAQVRRLLSIAAVYEGASRSEAAKLGGMDRQTLRDWVHRFNDEGPAGLVNRKAPGAPCKLTEDQMVDLIALVEDGPDPRIDGVVRWRRADLREVIEQRFGVRYHERSVSRLLHELGFSHVSVRPRHPEQDVDVLEAYKKRLPPEDRRAVRGAAREHQARTVVAG